MDIQLNKLNPKAGFTQGLVSILDYSIALGKPAVCLKSKFWAIYRKQVTASFKDFNSDDAKLYLLHYLMKELGMYADVIHLNLKRLAVDKSIMKKNKADILLAIKILVVRQCEIAVKKEAAGTPNTLQNDPWYHKHSRFSALGGRYPWRWTQTNTSLCPIRMVVKMITPKQANTHLIGYGTLIWETGRANLQTRQEKELRV